MNKKIALNSILGLACLIPAAALADDVQVTGEARTAMRAGANISADSEEEIRAIMKDAVTSVLDDGDFEDLVDNFAKADRERVGKFTSNEADALEAEVEKLKSNFKTKYNEAISLDGDDLARPVLGYQLISTDSKHATVRIPASSVVKDTTLKVLDEGTVKTTWRIDVPNEVSGSQIKTALTREIAKLNANVAAWPQNRHEATGVISQRILAVVGGSVS